MLCYVVMCSGGLGAGRALESSAWIGRNEGQAGGDAQRHPCPCEEATTTPSPANKLMMREGTLTAPSSPGQARRALASGSGPSNRHSSSPQPPRRNASSATMSSMLEGLGAALQALDGSAPLQRRRPAATMSSTRQPLLAPETVLLRMLLKEAAGVWRPAWVEVRPDGRILIFPETLTGGVGAPTESVERHVERLVDFMPVLDDFKAVCLRFLPPTGAAVLTMAVPTMSILALAFLQPTGAHRHACHIGFLPWPALTMASCRPQARQARRPSVSCSPPQRARRAAWGAA